MQNQESKTTIRFEQYNPYAINGPEKRTIELSIDIWDTSLEDIQMLLQDLVCGIMGSGYEVEIYEDGYNDAGSDESQPVNIDVSHESFKDRCYDHNWQRLKHSPWMRWIRENTGLFQDSSLRSS